MTKLILGDCLIKLKELEDNSVDSIVTDPPYGLAFMGKDWDKGVPGVHFWQEMIRVLKPGGHLLAFSGTRTYHRMAVAIEDAGFEVRDMIEWVYSTGFPKSLNLNKALQKKCRCGNMEVYNNERTKQNTKHDLRPVQETNEPTTNKDGSSASYRPQSEQQQDRKSCAFCEQLGTQETRRLYEETYGVGSALKPAHEPICLARKPLSEKNLVDNFIKYGTGGINIDDSRVDVADSEKVKQEGHIRKGNVVGDNRTSVAAGQFGDGAFVAGTDLTNGRFPANLIHDNSEEVRECFPDDSSRFFKSIIYQAKASKSERNRGCEMLEEKIQNNISTNARTFNDRCLTCKKKFVGSDNTICHCPSELKITDKTIYTNKNNHPTVKPIALMEYLIKMVTPKGGTVLDPFMGSGSTGVAAKENGFSFIGIEMEEEYMKIAEERIKAVPNKLF